MSKYRIHYADRQRRIRSETIEAESPTQALESLESLTRSTLDFYQVLTVDRFTDTGIESVPWEEWRPGEHIVRD